MNGNPDEDFGQGPGGSPLDWVKAILFLIAANLVLVWVWQGIGRMIGGGQ